MADTNRTTQDYVNLKKLDKLSWWLDSAIRVPGTSWRIGLDGIVGLIPGIGDITAGAMSSYIVMQAVKMGVAPAVIARMVLNILLETIVGIIPIVGDLFDFAFRANIKNVALIQDYVDAPAPAKKSSIITVTLTILILAIVLICTLWLGISLLSWLIELIG